MKLLISTSASKTKSLRGAQAYIAVSRIKVEDETHESSVKKGEKFYLKKLGKSLYFIDVEREGGKNVLYQYKIDKKLYDALSKKHKAGGADAPVTSGRPTDPATGQGRSKRPATKTAMNPKQAYLAKQKAKKKKAADAKKAAALDMTPEVSKAIKDVRKLRKLAASKAVSEYKDLLRRRDYLKRATHWEDPDQRQIKAETEANEKAIKDFESNTDVKAFNKSGGNKPESDIIMNALKTDPTFIKLQESFDSATTARQRTPRYKKMDDYISMHLDMV